MWFIVNIFRYGIRSVPLKPTRRLISFFADSQDKIDGNVVIFRQCNQNRCRNISFAVFVIGIRSLRAVQNSGKMCLRYFVFFSKTFQILILHQSKLSRFHTPYYKVEQSVLDALRTNRSEFLICRMRFAYTKKEPYRISIRKCSVKALIWESGAALCHAFPLACFVEIRGFSGSNKVLFPLHAWNIRHYCPYFKILQNWKSQTRSSLLGKVFGIMTLEIHLEELKLCFWFRVQFIIHKMFHYIFESSSPCSRSFRSVYIWASK